MNKKNIVYLLLPLFLVACSDDDPVTPDPPKEQTANDWIVETMRKEYLWNDDIPRDAKLDLSAEPTDFFYSLLSKKDGKDTQSGHYYYSSINKKDKSTKSYLGDSYSYGFEFQYYYITNLKMYALQVLYVLPDSPADKAGLKRGEWIIQMNSNAVTDSGTELTQLLYPTGSKSLTIGVGKRPSDTNPRKLSMKSAMVFDDPVLVNETILYGNKRVGYLVYNHFTIGTDNDAGDETFDNSLRKAFAQFKEDNLDEFILDLRYNGGGYVTCAQLLATMLAPESTLHSGQEVFCKLTDNNNKYGYYYFDQKLYSEGVGVRGANLNLKKLYVITSDRTASSSEAVINGLNPYMDVIIVGEQTEGKNVGSRPFSSEKYDWEIHPIVSYISNSKGFSDYSKGFEPTFPCSESNQTEMADLGDPDEFILGEVLDYIVSGDQIQSKSTLLRSSDLMLEPLYNSLDRKKTHAVLLPSEE